MKFQEKETKELNQNERTPKPQAKNKKTISPHPSLIIGFHHHHQILRETQKVETNNCIKKQ